MRRISRHEKGSPKTQPLQGPVSAGCCAGVCLRNGRTVGVGVCLLHCFSYVIGDVKHRLSVNYTPQRIHVHHPLGTKLSRTSSKQHHSLSCLCDGPLYLDCACNQARQIPSKVLSRSVCCCLYVTTNRIATKFLSSAHLFYRTYMVGVTSKTTPDR